MKVPEPQKTTYGYRIQLRLGGRSVVIKAATARDCRRQAELAKAEHRAGVARIASAGDKTLGEAVSEYIEKYKAVLSPATIRGYAICRRNRFKAWQSVPLSKIQWQRMLDDELKVVSKKTVVNAWGLVRSALALAGYPIPSVKLARPAVREIAFLQPEEIPPFLSAIYGRSYEIPALLALHGLRVSEILALTGADIDIRHSTIKVHSSLVPSVDGYVLKDTNKTKTSTRTVPILIPRLAELLAACAGSPEALVHIAANNLLNDIKRSCERAGVTVVTTHGLRHSFASLGYHLKISERQLMLWGGWSDYQTMHKIYIRVAASDENVNRDKLTEFFKNAYEIA